VPPVKSLGGGQEGAALAEERFRLLVESITDYAIFILDPTGHVLTWNLGAERINGYRADEIIGKHFSIFYPPEDIASGKTDRELATATSTGRFEEEGWRIRKDGRRLWANVTITAMRGPDGALVGFAKVTRDLTERRQSEEETRRFRLLVESVRDYAIFILDPGGYVLTWNLGAERIKGYKANEIIGKHFSTFYPPEDVAAGKTERELAIAARAGRYQEEGWRVRKDGSRLWASVTITAMHNPEGKLIGFAKVTRDLSERRQAEEEARRFRLLVESVKDYAIFILDPTGHVLTWNLGAERIKGYKANEIIGKHFSIFYPLEDVAAGKCELELEGATRTGRFEDEGWRVRSDNSRIWASVVITALRNPDGTLLGFAKVTRDLTERREAEEAQRILAAERAKLEEKSRIQEFQERFLAILGHDLRNPLASIDMGAGILRQVSKDPTTIRVLDRMQSSSQRMSRMIEQILDLTRTRLAGGLELNPRPMDLRDLIAHMAEELRLVHPSRTIELRSSPLPGVWDPDRLEQVFSNLIGNALLYGDPATPITIDGRIEGRVALVDVHNDGDPIPDEIQATIFSPFRRGERDSRTSKTAGLGLGLYISREVTIAHGGGIDLRSSVAEGTTFRVTLPAT
jgi:PAS domain S-box-containing protein